MPESARWLHQTGRKEEAARIIQKIAEKNGVVLSEKLRSLEDVEAEAMKDSIWHMFTHRSLVIRSIILFFNW